VHAQDHFQVTRKLFHPYTSSTFLWVRIFPPEAPGHHPTGSSQRLQLAIQETNSSPPSTKVRKHKEWFDFRAIDQSNLHTRDRFYGSGYNLFGLYGSGSGTLRPGLFGIILKDPRPDPINLHTDLHTTYARFYFIVVKFVRLNQIFPQKVWKSFKSCYSYFTMDTYNLSFLNLSVLSRTRSRNKSFRIHNTALLQSTIHSRKITKSSAIFV
jgi:hypothetical protein